MAGAFDEAVVPLGGEPLVGGFVRLDGSASSAWAAGALLTAETIGAADELVGAAVGEDVWAGAAGVCAWAFG